MIAQSQCSPGNKMQYRSNIKYMKMNDEPILCLIVEDLQMATRVTPNRFMIAHSGCSPGNNMQYQISNTKY